jgi:hypothetical protein
LSSALHRGSRERVCRSKREIDGLFRMELERGDVISPHEQVFERGFYVVPSPIRHLLEWVQPIDPHEVGPLGGVAARLDHVPVNPAALSDLGKRSTVLGWHELTNLHALDDTSQAANPGHLKSRAWTRR